MCVGGDSGDASLLELSNSLVTCTKAEKVDVVGDVDHDDDEQLVHMYKGREGEQANCHPGDDGDDAGPGEQAGEDIVSDTERGEAEGEG